MDPGAATIKFVRGDRALLLECVFPDVTDWTGTTAYLDCRVGGEGTDRLFALSQVPTADGVILLTSGNGYGLTGSTLQAWLYQAKSATVPAGTYRFGLRVFDAAGAPLTHLAGPVLVRPSPTVQP